ncbi:GspH/FimT family pseudopilin [Methylophaga sp.]|uniref:GspH/FimT family pseudopilin n=1 Tax=Methylophaga sp. TaxID=2024840 RepID=UPI003F6A0966
MGAKIKGFTIIELMIIITLIGVLAALSTPYFASILEGRRLVGSADTLHSVLQFARSESIKQNTDVQVYTDTAAWCIGIDDTSGGLDCDCTNPASCTVNGSVKVYNDSDYRGVNFTNATVNTVTFQTPNALPDNASTYTFTSSSGTTRKVILNPIGLISVSQ